MRSICAITGAAIGLAALGGCAVKDAAELYQEQHAPERAAARADRIAENSAVRALIMREGDPRDVVVSTDPGRRLKSVMIEDQEFKDRSAAKAHAEVAAFERAEKERQSRANAWRSSHCASDAQPSIGMTEAALLASPWCRPSNVNRSVTADHQYAQYVYEFADGRSAYFYFTDGQLTSVQTGEPY